MPRVSRVTVLVERRKHLRIGRNDENVVERQGLFYPGHHPLDGRAKQVSAGEYRMPWAGKPFRYLGAPT